MTEDDIEAAVSDAIGDESFRWFMNGAMEVSLSSDSIQHDERISCGAT